ncbi:MAG: biotin--[acetyl-CoA-carboxylase] ligase [Ignavibacteriaceae bacterium]|nr:MAG: biotin--[acetyl-CoA-carboxylase] ligase [Ignavibacterium sp.]MDX9712655.1 biotin--[acetyl-CoA-carboxylase] ligase [Ignavibacteriaceae bacterium]MEB2354143.1 biotin--[acetyl-CoA-carboxylase] ligase [Ignavibacteriales bacterium]
MFNIENFDIKLNTEYIGRNFIYTEEINSTNTFLLAKENGQNINGTVMLAEKQTEGKGRKGRNWQSAPEVNLLFSILLTNDKSLFKNANLINFAASLAVSMSVENLYQLKTDLKWPNDVLINGKKISGILIEAVSQSGKIERLVLGIGINVNQNSFQGSFNYLPTSLRNELGKMVEREKLLADILNNLEVLLERLKNDKNNLIEDWKQKCRMLGNRITITDNEIEKSGIFYDIDEDGFLLLQTKDEIEKIHFGDVSLY